MKRNSRQGGSDGYEVGYGKPPLHTRFQPGRSGNPKGRPKGTKNFRTDLAEELSERILVREGDRARHVSKQRALIMTLMASTLKGNTRSASLLLTMMLRLDLGEATNDAAEPLREDELEILRNFEDRVRRDRPAKSKRTRRNKNSKRSQS